MESGLGILSGKVQENGVIIVEQTRQMPNRETMCELCNALKTISPICTCGTTMLDSGPVTDYSGPYSPYFNTAFEENRCHHLFTCPACGIDTVISLPLRKK